MPSARAGVPADTASDPPAAGAVARLGPRAHGRRTRAWASAVVAAVSIALGVAGRALAQTDEIQVYDGGLADPGVLNLTLHNNHTPKGLATPAFPGGVV